MLYYTIAALSLLPFQALAGQNNVFLRWASYGGGWRAMMADTAYANVFSQVGLFDPEPPAETCKLQSVSAESGGSWFTVQFFQSPQFFENVTESSPEGIYDFVLFWMNSYQQWTDGLSTRQPLCRVLGLGDDELAEMCDVMLDFDGDWALFVSGMLQNVSAAYGDPGFVDREVKSSTRNALLMETEEYIQSSLAANARIRGTESSTHLYIGPNHRDAIYSIPLPTQWSVTNDGEGFFYSAVGGRDGLSSLKVYASTVATKDDTFKYRDFKEYPLFQGENTTGTVLTIKPESATEQGFMAAPFGGQDPTVGQIASASSASLSSFSGLVPSFLAQYTSVELHELKESGAGPAELELYQKAVDDIYNLQLFDDLSVCTQWPGECSEMDSRFADGTYTDMPTLALNVAQFQARESWDDGTVLKVFVTSHYQSLGADAAANTMAYFNSTYNMNGEISPGDFMWPNETGPWPVPVFSPQIFGDYLTYDMIEAVTQTYTETNATTAILSGTTINNPVFGVTEGLKVEIMLFRTNAFISNTIIGSDMIEATKYELANMAEEIASCQEMVDNVAAFVGDICQPE